MEDNIAVFPTNPATHQPIRTIIGAEHGSLVFGILQFKTYKSINIFLWVPSGGILEAFFFFEIKVKSISF